MRHILYLLPMAMLLAACTQDELAQQDDTLPEGKYPLELTAGGLQAVATPTPDTRATVDNNWIGVQTVAVKVGDEVKEYTVIPSGGGATATLSSTDPFYWQSATTPINITAWHPYSAADPTTWAVKENQSSDENYQASDFLFAQQTAVYQNDNSSVSLNFYHQVAKVKVNILKGDETPAGLSITGLTIGGIATSGTFTAPALGGTTTTPLGTWSVTDQNQSITPHAATATGGNTLATYEALVIPQTVSGNVRLFTIAATGYSDFVYTPTEAITWQSGMEYTYNITIKGSGLEVTMIQSIGWNTGSTGSGSVNINSYDYDETTKTYTVYNAEGLLAWAKAANNNLNSPVNCTLAADITLTGENNWTPVGTNVYAYSGTVDGAGYTISGMNISDNQHTQGFIGHLSGTVKNLTITGASVNGSNNIGGIVGIADAESNIIGCTFSGDISARLGSAAGIVGSATGCTITGCSASGTVIANQNTAAGIVGSSINNEITACWSTADVTVTTYGGCIAGNSMQSTYTACYWGNTTTAAGIGDSMDTSSPIHVDGSNVTWSTAMEAMNSALANSGFQWTENTDAATQYDVPLLLNRETE